MGAFLISPLPPLLLEPLQTAGLLRSTGVTPFPRYYRPSRFPLADHRLPGVAGYTASLLRRFLDGTRRVFPVAQHDLVTVLSLPTPPKCFAASVLLRRPMLPSPESCQPSLDAHLAFRISSTLFRHGDYSSKWKGYAERARTGVICRRPVPRASLISR